MTYNLGPELLRTAFEQETRPETLRLAFGALLNRIDGLEARLGAASSSERSKAGGERKPALIQAKSDRLAEIRHGLTELSERMQRPYIVSSELRAVKDVLDTLAESGACNSVILEGEPGTGKTQWAYSEVGQELRDGKGSMLIHVRVKETMTAQDLLYSVDAVRRLSDAQARSQVPDAIREEAAGWKARILSGEIDPTEDKDYLKFKAKMKAVEELSETGKDLGHINYIDLGPLGEAIKQSGEGKKVWLIIDELEKGREELMTGLLDEIENLTFTIAETGTKITGDKRNLRIVITTNTEDSDKIPSSFRRRSLYHFLEYPTQGEMAEIVSLHFPHLEKVLLDYALDVYYAYHEHPQIAKKPSTPELLAWIEVLSREFDGEIPDDVPHKEILLKFKDDHEVEIALAEIETKQKADQEKEDQGKIILRRLTKAAEGNQIFRLRRDLFENRDLQDQLARIYATLDQHGCSFVTPAYEPVRDHYGDDTGQVTVKRAFQLLVPGVEDLGDGYFVLPKLIEKILAPVIDRKINMNTQEDFSDIGMTRDQIAFDVIEEKNPSYVHGSLRIGMDSGEPIHDVYRLGADVYIFESEYDVPADTSDKYAH